MNQYINAFLGVPQNVKPSTSINLARGAGMLTRRSPYGMAAMAAAYGGKKAWDYFTDDEEEGIEPTPAREDYLATLNNKFSDEELEEFQKGALTGYRPVLPWNQKANQVQNINQWNKDN